MAKEEREKSTNSRFGKFIRLFFYITGSLTFLAIISLVASFFWDMYHPEHPQPLPVSEEKQPSPGQVAEKILNTLSNQPLHKTLLLAYEAYYQDKSQIVIDSFDIISDKLKETKLFPISVDNEERNLESTGKNSVQFTADGTLAVYLLSRRTKLSEAGGEFEGAYYVCPCYNTFYKIVKGKAEQFFETGHPVVFWVLQLDGSEVIFGEEKRTIEEKDKGKGDSSIVLKAVSLDGKKMRTITEDFPQLGENSSFRISQDKNKLLGAWQEIQKNIILTVDLKSGKGERKEITEQTKRFSIDFLSLDGENLLLLQPQLVSDRVKLRLFNLKQGKVVVEREVWGLFTYSTNYPTEQLAMVAWDNSGKNIAINAWTTTKESGNAQILIWQPETDTLGIAPEGVSSSYPIDWGQDRRLLLKSSENFYLYDPLETKVQLVKLSNLYNKNSQILGIGWE